MITIYLCRGQGGERRQGEKEYENLLLHIRACKTPRKCAPRRAHLLPSVVNGKPATHVPAAVKAH